MIYPYSRHKNPAVSAAGLLDVVVPDEALDQSGVLAGLSDPVEDPCHSIFVDVLYLLVASLGRLAFFHHSPRSEVES